MTRLHIAMEVTASNGTDNTMHDGRLPRIDDDVNQVLDVLLHVMTQLQIDDINFTSYANAIDRLTDQSLALSRSINRLNFAEEELKDHLASVKHGIQILKKWKESAAVVDASPTENAENMERQRETLLRKAKEYHKELESLLAVMPDNPSITVTQLTKQQEKNDKKEQDLKAKRAKIKAFQGLPPNIELARHELRNAQDEQMKLVKLRERLLGKMAASVS